MLYSSTVIILLLVIVLTSLPVFHMLPFLDALLSDSSFLRDIEWRIHRLVCLKAEYSQYGEFDNVGDKDLVDGMAFAISRAFLDKVDGYVESALRN